MFNFFKENIFSFVIIVLLAIFIGMIIIGVVDKRLSEVSINIPKQNIIVNVNKGNVTVDEETEYATQSKKEILENFSSIQLKNPVNSMPVEKSPEGFNKNIVYMQGCNTSKDCNTLPWNNGENICINNHCHCNSGTGTFCQYGPTNFPDPKDMTKVDSKIFKFSYPSNMTLQDYINWLWLYKDDTESLTADHLSNLLKLKRGEFLRYEYGITPPLAKNTPPFNSEDYFNKIYNADDINITGSLISDTNPLNSYTGSLMAYNYNDYPEFIGNFNQYKKSGKVSDPTGIVNKVNAKDLDNLIKSKDSVIISNKMVNKIYSEKNK